MRTNKLLIIVIHDINSRRSLVEFTTTTICYETLCDCTYVSRLHICLYMWTPTAMISEIIVSILIILSLD